MGGEVCRAVDGADDLDLVARLDLGDPLTGLAAAGAQVVVDFTHPGAVLDNLRYLLDAGIAAVVGTSGFDDSPLRDPARLARRHPRARAGGAPTSGSARCS